MAGFARLGRGVLYCLAAIALFSIMSTLNAPTATAVVENYGDGYIEGDTSGFASYPANNYGTETFIQVGPIHGDHGLIRFDISEVPGIIGDAYLNLYMYSGDGSFFASAWACENIDWDENVVTYNTWPSVENMQDNVEITSVGWYSWDVTDAVTVAYGSGTGKVTIELSFSPPSGSDYAMFGSKEYTAGLRPYLTIDENAPNEIYVRWETNYELVSDGTCENAIENRDYHLTIYYPTATSEFDMTENPENFVATATVRKIRLDVTSDNYWRTRIPSALGVVDMILVDNVGDLDQYEFTLKDLTGQFGIDDNGWLQFSRYMGDNLLYVHEDFWDAEDSVTAFLIYGKEYSLKLVTDTQERSYSRITADGILTKEISVATFTMPDARMLWDNIAWSTWWDNADDLKVSYQDNVGETDNVMVNIYDENDDLAYAENFTTGQWTLTWAAANENLDYIVTLNIAHQTFGASIVSTDILMPSWTPPIEEEGAIPGIGQLGTLPFTWGAGIGIILVMTIAYTFGARHAGFCVLTIGMFLVMLGPVMGLFRLNADPALEWGFASFIIVMGVLIMLTKRGG